MERDGRAWRRIGEEEDETTSSATATENLKNAGAMSK
jgi:hypothetical protein